ncbi:MAG: hypothetical protein JNK02_17700 [Planctomycetes bacterium]|nr:hypothetical protein [Planctomycetota bacterium]
MKTLILSATLGLALAPAAEIQTKYEPGPGRKVTIESATSTKRTIEIEGGGEIGSGRGGGSMEIERREVHVDHVLAVEDGRPSKVRRHFTDLGGKSASEFGEMSRESELESPWEGVTLELVADGADVEARVKEGKEPTVEGALEGHRLELFLDAFLPKGPVEPGTEWELADAAIRRGLRLDLQRKLFPPPEVPEGEGRGGGGGRRGGGNRPGGGDSLLTQSEWKGSAKLVGAEEKAGANCYVVEIEVETSGEREIQGGFGGRRGGSLEPAFENRMTWSAKLQGKLWFDVSNRRPMLLELEGSLKEESIREMERQGQTLRTRSTGSGTIDYRVEVEDAPALDAKSAK